MSHGQAFSEPPPARGKPLSAAPAHRPAGSGTGDRHLPPFPGQGGTPAGTREATATPGGGRSGGGRSWRCRVSRAGSSDHRRTGPPAPPPGKAGREPYTPCAPSRPRTSQRAMGHRGPAGPPAPGRRSPTGPRGPRPGDGDVG
ncbi:hypothetical protein SHJG_7472 [Streptomyces hygroscopicus subsp. jinggangensis 5008]|nr:hypothetical protein SHJG_7472 [Streptomyces hygroscopicus subsp. jinggangensis 5008]AGF66894.1 hypothetical protein SHJGH_7232 [Streptomyces hygroscopicus subsp. jinggangensis TL01]